MGGRLIRERFWDAAENEKKIEAIIADKDTPKDIVHMMKNFFLTYFTKRFFFLLPAHCWSDPLVEPLFSTIDSSNSSEVPKISSRFGTFADGMCSCTNDIRCRPSLDGKISYDKDYIVLVSYIG